MNEGDLGNKAAEQFLDVAIRNARRTTGNEMLTGFCQNDCGEPTAGAYCSAECRNDHTKRMRLKR